MPSESRVTSRCMSRVTVCVLSHRDSARARERERERETLNPSLFARSRSVSARTSRTARGDVR